MKKGFKMRKKYYWLLSLYAPCCGCVVEQYAYHCSTGTLRKHLKTINAQELRGHVWKVKLISVKSLNSAWPKKRLTALQLKALRRGVEEAKDRKFAKYPPNIERLC